MSEEFVSKPNIPERKVKCAVISELVPDIVNELQRLGIRTIISQRLDSVEGSESAHADMSLFHVGNEQIYVSRNISPVLRDRLVSEGMSVTYTEMPVTAKAPCLNACLIGDKVICNTKLIDKGLMKKLSDSGKQILHTNQGYAKCSTAVVNENAVITADNSIYELCRRNDIDVLHIEYGHIMLEGYPYGFIGGSCALLSPDTLAFFGDISKHPDYSNIRSFTKNHGVDIISLSNQELYDVGGIIAIKC